jgi:arylsulfatase
VRSKLGAAGLTFFAWLLPGCGVEKPASAPIRFSDRVSGAAAAPVELADETRRAFTLGLGSRLELELTLPESPILSFAIGASSPERPTLLAPVVFRALVDDTEVFQETIRRSQGAKWFPRDVDLGPWGGKAARLVLEARRGEGGVEGSESHIAAHFANPVVRSRHQRPETAALILISIDCLRADHVGAYGYSRQTTPNLDAFAREATLFRNAMAASSYTLPTHASMLTGLPPSLHGATGRRRISRSVDTLPEILSEMGYKVQGVVSGPFLAPLYGFGDGFDTHVLSSVRAQGLVDRALALLDEGAGFRQFLFLHLFDVHAPYSPPEEFITLFGERPKDITGVHSYIRTKAPPSSPVAVQQLKNLYDAEIAYVDRELGRFFAELEKRGFYDPSLILVTADHGEAFYEHGTWDHGRPWHDDVPRLFQEIVHVPLLVKAPYAREGAVVEDVVSQTDVYATFLDAAGFSAEEARQKSLLRPREAEGNGWTLAEFVATPAPGRAMLELALRRQNLKYHAVYRASSAEEIYTTSASEEALYDLASDPGERRNLLAEDEGAAAAPREVARRYLEVARERRAQYNEEEVTLDPELQRQLESLGYLER